MLVNTEFFFFFSYRKQVVLIIEKHVLFFIENATRKERKGVWGYVWYFKIKRKF